MSVERDPDEWQKVIEEDRVTADELGRLADYIGATIKYQERIAVALEQIALELVYKPDAKPDATPVFDAASGGFTVPRKPEPSDYYGGPASTISTAVQPTNHAQTAPSMHASFVGNASLGVPQLVPPQCPVHGKPWRNNSRGAYCATPMGDGTWCRQRPRVVTGLEASVLP